MYSTCDACEAKGYVFKTLLEPYFMFCIEFRMKKQKKALKGFKIVLYKLWNQEFTVFYSKYLGVCGFEKF